MAISSAATSGQSISASVWQTLQLQQAQRTADQARENARTLQSEAAQAQAAADQADQQARAIGREAQLAQSAVTKADLNLTSARVGTRLQAQTAQLAQNVHQAVQSLQPTVATTPTPITNVQGQVTGTVVNVKA